MSPTYCNYVCDPINNMAASCNKLCQGFIFTTTTQNPGTTQATTTQPQGSVEPYSDALQVVIPCVVSVVVILLLVVLVCCCKERLDKLKQSIKHGCLKLSVQETGHTGSSNSDYVLPGGRPVTPGEAIAEAHVQNEVRHPSEESVLLEDNPTLNSGRANAKAFVRNEVRHPDEESGLLEDNITDDSAAINGYESSSTNLSSEERRALINNPQPEVSIPNPSGLSAGTQYSSGYHSAYNQTGSHEEIVLKTMNLNEHIISSNTEAKTLF